MSASQRLGFMEIKHRLQSLEHQVTSLTNLCTTFAQQIHYLKSVQDTMGHPDTLSQSSNINITPQGQSVTPQRQSVTPQRQSVTPQRQSVTPQRQSVTTQINSNVREVSLSKNFPTQPSKSVPQKSPQTESNVSMVTEPVVKPKRKYTRRKKPEAKTEQTITIE